MIKVDKKPDVSGKMQESVRCHFISFPCLPAVDELILHNCSSVEGLAAFSLPLPAPDKDCSFHTSFIPAATPSKSLQVLSDRLSTVECHCEAGTRSTGEWKRRGRKVTNRGQRVLFTTAGKT